MRIYTWWGGSNPPPEHLKTRNQLGELNLSPRRAVGMIKTKKYDLRLYDPTDPESVRLRREPTEPQLKALETAREAQHRKRWGFLERDKLQAIAWAREVLRHRGAFVILDTETTCLYGEVIEIAIIDGQGNPLIDTLIRPSTEIEESAIAIHGITPDMVQDAPTIRDVWGNVEKAIAGKVLIIYNASFDIARLEFSLGETLNLKAECLMKRSAPYFGEWSEKYKDYKWQPLSLYQGNHRAKCDCLAALSLLNDMGR